MKKTFFFLPLLLSYALAQHETDEWVLNRGNTTTLSWNTMLLNVAVYPPTLTSMPNPTQSIEITGFGGICDTAGHLQFYTNGAVIANRNNDTLPGSKWMQDSSTAYTMSGPCCQTSVALSFPNDYAHYSVLNGEWIHGSGHTRRINRTEVDMSQGAGVVTAVRQPVIMGGMGGNMAGGALGACRHANGRDWWVVTPCISGRSYVRALVTPTTVSFDSVLFDKPDTTERFDGTISTFSPDGKYFALMGDSTLHLFDFDRQTGLLTHHRMLPNLPINAPHSLVFSSNSRWLYFLVVDYNLSSLYRYDMNEDNALQKGVLIRTSSGRGILGHMKLAPNKQLYFIANTGISAIPYPDSSDITAIGWNPMIVSPPSGYYITILSVYHPTYTLGALKGSACDTLGLPAYYTSTTKEVIGSRTVRVYPNPARDEVVFELPVLPTPNPSQEGNIGNPLLGGAGVGEVVLHDLLGREVLRKAARADTAQSGVSSVTLDISPLPNGIYLWHCAGQSGKLVIAR